MRYFPLFLDLADRPVLIVGGGEQAAQKFRLLARTPARITVLAPELCGELAGAAAADRLRHVPRVHDEAEVDAAAAVFCASGCTGVDAWIAARVAARGGAVNVVDKPRLCTVITPAIVDRAPLVVAIGTEGAAPVMGQRVKTRLEAWLSPSLGPFLSGLAALRPVLAEARPGPTPRAFWNWIMDGPRLRAEAGDVAGALAEVEAAIAAGGAPVGAAGRLSLIDLPAAPDLIPLRAVARMQEADLLIHPEGAAPALLALARRDAERLAYAGDWPAGAAAEAVAGGARVAALIPPGEAGTGDERIGAARVSAGPPSGG